MIRHLVSGAGGYADLHKIAAAGDERAYEDERLCENVQLENYCGEYYTVDARPGKEDTQPELFERFLFPLRFGEAVPVP